MTQATSCQNNLSVERRLRRALLLVARVVQVALAAPVACLVLLNGCAAGTMAETSAENQLGNIIRTYDPKTGEFSNRAGELRCSKPSVSDWEQSATEYQRAVGASIGALYRRFTACYHAQLRRNASTSGASCVRFTVGDAGQVTQVEIATSTLPEALQDCILIKGARASVPPPSKSPMFMQVPLRFVNR